MHFQFYTLLSRSWSKTTCLMEVTNFHLQKETFVSSASLQNFVSHWKCIKKSFGNPNTTRASVLTSVHEMGVQICHIWEGNWSTALLPQSHHSSRGACPVQFHTRILHCKTVKSKDFEQNTTGFSSSRPLAQLAWPTSRRTASSQKMPSC